MAHEEMTRFRTQHPAWAVEQLDVFRDRAACHAIEAETGVRHESPQVLIYQNGRVVWHASHRRVTASAVTDAVRASAELSLNDA